MSTDDALRSPLHDLHVAAGAVMASVAGWEMPARYGDARAEAAEARQSAAVADLSHWGRIRIRGGGAAELLARIGVSGAARQEDDTAVAVELRDGAGASIGRARVIRLEDFWLLITTPAARAGVLARAEEICPGLDVKVDDQTMKTAMIAAIGPLAAAHLDAVLPMPVSDLGDGEARTGSVLIAKYIAVRSDIGDGQSKLWRMEVILPGLLATRAWRFITDKAGRNRMSPIGTEAMDILGI